MSVGNELRSSEQSEGRGAIALGQQSNADQRLFLRQRPGQRRELNMEGGAKFLFTITKG